MKRVLMPAILVSAAVVLGLQTVLSFPSGIILGIACAVIIIWYAKAKSTTSPSRNPDDSQNADKEKKNQEYKILKDQFLDGKITKKEFDRLREPFEHCAKTNAVYKIAGVLTLAFGLVNILWYAPHSLTLVFQNQPFPFEHLTNVEIHEGGGIGIQIGYLPFNEALFDPYWLFWSLSLYGGITILSLVGIRVIKKHKI